MSRPGRDMARRANFFSPENGQNGPIYRGACFFSPASRGPDRGSRMLFALSLSKGLKTEYRDDFEGALSGCHAQVRAGMCAPREYGRVTRTCPRGLGHGTRDSALIHSGSGLPLPVRRTTTGSGSNLGDPQDKFKKHAKEVIENDNILQIQCL